MKQEIPPHFDEMEMRERQGSVTSETQRLVDERYQEVHDKLSRSMDESMLEELEAAKEHGQQLDEAGRGGFQRTMDGLIDFAMGEHPAQIEQRIRKRINEHQADAKELNKEYDEALAKFSEAYYRLSDVRKRLGLGEITVLEQKNERRDEAA